MNAADDFSAIARRQKELGCVGDAPVKPAADAAAVMAVVAEKPLDPTASDVEVLKRMYGRYFQAPLSPPTLPVDGAPDYPKLAGWDETAEIAEPIYRKALELARRRDAFREREARFAKLAEGLEPWRQKIVRGEQVALADVVAPRDYAGLYWHSTGAPALDVVHATQLPAPEWDPVRRGWVYRFEE